MVGGGIKSTHSRHFGSLPLSVPPGFQSTTWTLDVECVVGGK